MWSHFYHLNKRCLGTATRIYQGKLLLTSLTAFFFLKILQARGEHWMLCTLNLGRSSTTSCTEPWCSIWGETAQTNKTCSNINNRISSNPVENYLDHELHVAHQCNLAAMMTTTLLGCTVSGQEQWFFSTWNTWRYMWNIMYITYILGSTSARERSKTQRE